MSPEPRRRRRQVPGLRARPGRGRRSPPPAGRWHRPPSCLPAACWLRSGRSGRPPGSRSSPLGPPVAGRPGRSRGRPGPRIPFPSWLQGSGGPGGEARGAGGWAGGRAGGGPGRAGGAASFGGRGPELREKPEGGSDAWGCASWGRLELRGRPRDVVAGQSPSRNGQHVGVAVLQPCAFLGLPIILTAVSRVPPIEQAAGSVTFLGL